MYAKVYHSHVFLVTVILLVANFVWACALNPTFGSIGEAHVDLDVGKYHWVVCDTDLFSSEHRDPSKDMLAALCFTKSEHNSKLEYVKLPNEFKKQNIEGFEDIENPKNTHVKKIVDYQNMLEQVHCKNWNKELGMYIKNNKLDQYGTFQIANTTVGFRQQ